MDGALQPAVSTFRIQNTFSVTLCAQSTLTSTTFPASGSPFRWILMVFGVPQTVRGVKSALRSHFRGPALGYYTRARKFDWKSQIFTYWNRSVPEDEIFGFLALPGRARKPVDVGLGFPRVYLPCSSHVLYGSSGLASIVSVLLILSLSFSLFRFLLPHMCCTCSVVNHSGLLS